jgi:uncharacterized membrane protein
MKRCFFTGLATLLPLAMTFAFVIFLFNLLTDPFVDFFSQVLSTFGVTSEQFHLLSSQQAFRLFTQCVILVVLFGATLLLGVLTRWLFIHSVLEWAETILHRIPFISSIYRACSDVVRTIFSRNTGAFRQVVLVPYPREGTYSVGLITRETIPMLHEYGASDRVAVFIPTTPNPTSGFLVLYNREDVVLLDMSIEDAFKYVISCGVIPPNGSRHILLES